MSKPVNIYCTSCSHYNGDKPFFREKYGETGCEGLSFSSGEFPADQKAFCFTDKPLITCDEKHEQKIRDIIGIIQNNTVEESARKILKIL